MSDDDNAGPTLPTVIDLHKAIREGMPPLFAVPDPDEAEPTGLAWDDLAYLAERIMRTAISQIDWSDLRDFAAVVADDEEDINDIVRLMESATIEVIVGYTA